MLSMYEMTYDIKCFVLPVMFLVKMYKHDKFISKDVPGNHRQ